MTDRNPVEVSRDLVTSEGASAGSGSMEDPKPVSILGLLNVLLRRRRIILAFPLIVLLAMVPGWFRTKEGPPEYTAITTFDVESSGRPSAADGLAGQLGLATTSARPMYMQLLRTRALLGPVTAIEFTARTPAGLRRGTIADLYGINAPTPAERREITIEVIRGMIDFEGGRDDTPSLHVTTRWPDVSIQLADSLLVRLNQFNTGRQQSRVSQERRFTEARLEEKRRELRAVESRMQAFLLANRDFGNSPMLSFEHNRIDRDLQLKQSLYNTLANAYETARIDEVRNSPVVSVIEPAYIPREHTQPRPLPTKELVRLALALMFGTFVAFVVEFYMRNLAQHPGDREELGRLARQLGMDLRRPWRLFKR